MRRSRYLDEILTLDLVRDHKRIVRLDICFEFPFDTTRSLELALFRTFASPAVAGLLDATGEFSRAPQKRYDHTDLLISTFLEDGYDSADGRDAIRLMNAIHRRFEIANEDFLYVLSTFVFEPIRWNESPGLVRGVRALQRRVRTGAVPAERGGPPRRGRDARSLPELVPRRAARSRRAGDLRAARRTAPRRLRVPDAVAHLPASGHRRGPRARPALACAAAAPRTARSHAPAPSLLPARLPHR